MDPIRLGALTAALVVIRDRHQPVEEEAERYHREDDLPGSCPTPDSRYPSDPSTLTTILLELA